jgi:hypothetical protein
MSEMQTATLGVEAVITSSANLAFIDDSFFMACFMKKDWMVPFTIGPFFCFTHVATLALAKKDVSSSSTEVPFPFLAPDCIFSQSVEVPLSFSTAFNWPLSPSTTFPRLPTFLASIDQRLTSQETSSSLQMQYMTLTDEACPIRWHLNQVVGRTEH